MVFAFPQYLPAMNAKTSARMDPRAEAITLNENSYMGQIHFINYDKQQFIKAYVELRGGLAKNIAGNEV